ncbi:MAG: cupin domain-containing protein [Candidatus Aminicenantes bacterium]|nr:cupin domain-containing protein [Candidatus Aminicenantes bacterium]
MIVKKYQEVEKSQVIKEGVKDVSIRWLIGEDSGAPNFYLRLFEVAPGGYTPLHTHPWEHEVFVVEGKGKINTGERSLPIEKGSFALVLPGEQHRFENTGDTTLKFLCIIPTDGR